MSVSVPFFRSTEKLEEHVMHEEQFVITDETARKVEQAKLRDGPYWRWSTSVRTLESAWDRAEQRLRTENRLPGILFVPDMSLR